MITFADLIVGEKFVQAADFVFSREYEFDYHKLENTFDVSKLKDINVVYLHTVFKDDFFRLIRGLPHQFIVISHNCDTNVICADMPPNVIRWFSQNVAVRDDRLESLPIGLENSRWFPEVDKKRKILVKIQTNKSIKNVVYMNHNIATNECERSHPYELLSNKSFVTTRMGLNPYNFDQYLDDLHSHQFVVSPAGNGIDTHRKWEALYVGTIPIEKRCVNSVFYEDLPICLIDDWEQVTEEFLESEYRRITCTIWNLEKLKMSWWLHHIQSARQFSQTNS
jgi:hypothetical protein